MSSQVTCPGCHRTLVIPAGCDAPWLSCPRCLARIPNPGAPSTAPAGAPAGTGIQPGPSSPPAAPTPEEVRECPGCGREVDGPWRYCPGCGTDMTARRPGRRRPGVDVDVRRDTRRTGCGLIALAVLGGLGILDALAGGVVAGSEGEYGPLIFVLLVLLVLGLVSGFRVYTRNREAPAAARIGRTVFGMLTIAGVITLVVLVIGLAALVFLFVVCLSELSGHH